MADDTTKQTLAQLLENQQQMAAQVAALSQQLPGTFQSTLTVDEMIPQVVATLDNARTRDTYTTTYTRMSKAQPCWYPDAHGRPRDPALCKAHRCDHRPGGALLLHDYDTERIQRLGKWVYRRAREVARLRIARKRLATMAVDHPELTLADIVVPDDDLPAACGHEALRSYVHASNYFWGQALRLGHVVVNPMADLGDTLDKPRNPRGGTRALFDHEVAHLEQIVQLCAADPDADSLLVWFHLETGARVSDALKFALEDIDPDRQTLLLGKKGDWEREQPVSASLIEALIAHAVHRGAEYDHERVFRIRDGAKVSPLTESHYGTLWARIRKQAEWADRDSTSTHALRKTTATALERRCGLYVAEAYLGHLRRSGDSNDPYLRADVHELALAIETLTGEYHPLARDTAAWLPADHVRPAPR